MPRHGTDETAEGPPVRSLECFGTFSLLPKIDLFRGGSPTHRTMRRKTA